MLYTFHPSNPYTSHLFFIISYSILSLIFFIYIYIFIMFFLFFIYISFFYPKCLVFINWYYTQDLYIRPSLYKTTMVLPTIIPRRVSLWYSSIRWAGGEIYYSLPINIMLFFSFFFKHPVLAAAPDNFHKYLLYTFPPYNPYTPRLFFIISYSILSPSLRIYIYITCFLLFIRILFLYPKHLLSSN